MSGQSGGEDALSFVGLVTDLVREQMLRDDQPVSTVTDVRFEPTI